MLNNSKNSIELTYRGGQEPDLIHRNAPEANLVGLELEYRKDISSKLSLSSNMSFIWSEVDLSSVDGIQNKIGQLRRPMAGQSPYIINFNAYYNFSESTNLALGFNTFGKRITVVGSAEQEKDVYEEPLNKLDLTLKHQINNIKLKLSVKNILSDDHVEKQNGLISKEYDKGMDISVSASFSL